MLKVDWRKFIFAFEKIKQNVVIIPPFLEDVLSAVSDQLKKLYSVQKLFLCLPHTFEL